VGAGFTPSPADATLPGAAADAACARGQGYDRLVTEPTTIRIPRWIQLVGLPVLLLFAFLLARPLGHVLFLFLTAAVIAFTLNPLVRDLTRLRLPRGLAVAVVSVVFAAAFIALMVALGTVVVSESRSAADRIDAYFTEESPLTSKTDAEVDVDRLQGWLNEHGLEGVQLEEQLNDLTDSIGAGDISGYAQDAISFAQDAALSVILLLFSLILVVVISIYMLLDMPRLEDSIDRRFPPHGGPPLTQRIERALWGYVKGQAILSVVIGTSAGVGMWILGTMGWVEGAEKYALLFGIWTAFIEVIPYIGPWLSAVPPAIYALVADPPWGILWVAGLFLFIYQVEGHVVVPNVMASALRLHPLLVIFGLLSGGALYGIPGVLVALPTMAAGRAIWEFFGERIDLESWEDAPQGPVAVEVELEPPKRVREAP
jgi:predicted PurR-regulated permease PerM